MKTFLLFFFGFVVTSVQAEDSRVAVDFPPMMQNHMLANMRDHLAALAEANELAAEQQWDKAAEVIEQRLGMSSLDDHGAGHMAKMMPAEMQALGTAMHQSASRLSRTLQEGDAQAVIGGMADLMNRCNACHSAFKLR